MSTDLTLEKSLVARALEAYQEASAKRVADRDAREAAEREMRVGIMRRKLGEVIGMEDAERATIDNDGKTADVDGLTFILQKFDYSYELHLRSTCPDCGGSRISYEVNDLDDVGMFISEDGSGQYHECRPPKPPTAEQQLFEGIVPDEPKGPSDAERAFSLLRQLVDLLGYSEGVGDC